MDSSKPFLVKNILEINNDVQEEIAKETDNENDKLAEEEEGKNQGCKNWHYIFFRISKGRCWICENMVLQRRLVFLVVQPNHIYESVE